MNDQPTDGLMRTEGASPLSILICAAPESTLPQLLRERGALVAAADSGLQALVRSTQGRPDIVVLDAGMPGLAPLDVCRVLHADRLVGATVPTLVLVRDRPTPEERVAGVRAGVWEFVVYAGEGDIENLWLKLQTHAEAKRNIDEVLADGLADPATGILSGPGLVRRGRELVALMARERAAVACLVFSVPEGLGAADPGAIVAGAARVSDVVGMLDPKRFALIAPATDEAGAVRLAERVRTALHGAARGAGENIGEPVLRVGYHAIGNVRYRPIDSIELLRRATAALDSGTPEPSHPWVRRFSDELPVIRILEKEHSR